ncbi:MAG: hypothetical protein WBP61_07295 [Nocardioides sp.]
MKNLRIISAAGVATLALAGGAALTGSTAQAADGDGDDLRMPARPAERAVISNCTGGPALGMSTRSMDFQNVPSGSAADVEGSQWQVKGPKKGKDTVLVTFTAFANSGGAGELTSVSLYKNGVGTSESPKYFTYNGEFDQATVQFCTKIKKGQNSLHLRVSDDFGTATTMYFPTVTYQRFK